MKFRQLKISGSFEIQPILREDKRGFFYESFRADLLQEHIGYPFVMKQANVSSSSKGVVRGIHFADVPDGQAKYVTVLKGKILDFVIDLRVGSSTFGQWDSVEISAEKKNALFIADGIGHAFLSLEDETLVNYFVSEFYNPDHERAINPLDRSINLAFPFDNSALIFSDKDLAAESFNELNTANLLPNEEDCLSLRIVQKGIKS